MPCGMVFVKEEQTARVCFLCLCQDLMKDLQEFLKNSQEKEDTVCLDVADPPCKRLRLEHKEEGAAELNHNGAIPQLPSAGNSALQSSAGRVCNVCLGILQEFCEPDFVKKVHFFTFWGYLFGVCVCWGLQDRAGD